MYAASFSRFTAASILPLEPEAIEWYLERWSLCLRDHDPTAAAEHYKELKAALDNSPWEIRRMARNPLMLSALAVVHYNEKRLPDQRAELYECILQWLARSRPPRHHDLLEMFGFLALSMQDLKGGYRTRLGRGKAADILAGQFQIKNAEALLAQEQIASGIVTSESESDVRFYHRSFQEYLAARYIAELRHSRRWENVKPRLWRQEWRESLVLLAGCLHGKGRDSLDEFFEELLAHRKALKKPEDRARLFGLAASMLADLRAVKYSLGQPAVRDYEALRVEVMRIFEPDGAPDLPIKTRAAIADALGQAGDPRLRLPDDPDYWGKLKGLTVGRFPVTVFEYARFVDAG